MAQELFLVQEAQAGDRLGRGLEMCWGCRCSGWQELWRPVGTHRWEPNRSSWLAPDPATPQSQQACFGLDLGVGTAARLLQAFWVTAYCPCFFIFQFKT